jgi:hypothetical protein
VRAWNEGKTSSRTTLSMQHLAQGHFDGSVQPRADVVVDERSDYCIRSVRVTLSASVTVQAS